MEKQQACQVFGGELASGAEAPLGRPSMVAVDPMGDAIAQRKLVPIPAAGSGDDRWELGDLVGQRWAVLVGINTYTDPNIGRLKFCVNDVQALAELLERLGYTVVCLYDQHPQEHRQPTKENVEAELGLLCRQVGPEDLLFVHFACHGVLLEQQPVLVMQNSRMGVLARQGLPVVEVEGMMRGSGARRLFLSLDACHTGVELGRGLVDDPEFIRNVYELAQGFAVMAASTAQQVAQEWHAVQHGVYSYYLLRALAGEAAREGKEFVTVNDVQEYVLHHLKRWRVEHSGLIQEPTVKVEGVGTMILADWRDRSAPKVDEQTREEKMSSVRRQVYEQQRQEKLKDLASVMRDLAGVQTQEEERRLNTRMEQLLEDIEALDKKLD
jgi:uncharacterized caspase-like protein